VLHEGELTYSVVGGDRDGLGGGIHETYCLITNALRRGLQRLGVETIIGSSKAAGWEGAACFQVGTAADLMWQGRKIAGSAQCRRGDAFLQHGSVLIDQDLGRLGRVLATPLAMAEAAVNLETAAGRRFDWHQVMKELCVGFSEHFAVKLVPGELSAQELELTAGLLRGILEREKRSIEVEESWSQNSHNTTVS
jgi:lipoate-protein ligase A